MEIWKCKYCEKELELKSKYTKSGHLAKCKKFKEWKNKVLTKEFLEEEYIKNGKSAWEIAINFGFNSTSIINNKLRKYNIIIRNISDSKYMERSIKKTKTTC